MRKRILAALLLPLLLLSLPARAQMYRWVDESGKVHYSDRVPEPGAKNVQKQSAAAGRGSTGLPYALQQAVKNFPVTLYTSDNCKETCAQARELLNKRGVPYSEVNVKEEAEIAQLKQLSGDTAIPVMTVGREVYKGYDSGTYQTALDTASYPASSQLPPGAQARQPVAKPVQKPAPAAADAEGKPAPPAQEAAGDAKPK